MTLRLAEARRLASPLARVALCGTHLFEQRAVAILNEGEGTALGAGARGAAHPAGSGAGHGLLVGGVHGGLSGRRHSGPAVCQEQA